MATFNFTVRATDSEGSFADRNFAINVRNTKIERYAAVTNVSTWTSADGMNWTERLGASGDSIAFGNMMWFVVKASSSSLVWAFRRSFDGVNFESVSRNTLPLDSLTELDGTPVAWSAATSGQFLDSDVHFHNGYFYFVIEGGSANGAYGRWIIRTEDGLNFVRIPLPTVTPNPGIAATRNFTFTSDGDSLILNNPQTNNAEGFRSNDNGATWTPIVRNIGSSYATNLLTRVNGIYFSFAKSGATYYTSIDGANWTQRTLPADANANYAGWAVASLTYVNGKLVAIFERISTASGSTNGFMLTSLDGIDWTFINLGAVMSGQVGVNVTSTYKNGLFMFAYGHTVSKNLRVTDDFETINTLLPEDGGISNGANNLDYIYGIASF